MARGADVAKIAGGIAAVGLILWLCSKFAPEPREKRIREFVLQRVRRAAAILGIAPPPVVSSHAVPSAASDGSHILYNPEWVAAVLAQHCENGECDDEVVLGVVAHELGHHGLGHAFTGLARSHTNELEADFRAGQVLAAAGVGFARFAEVLRTQNPWPTQTHPTWESRVAQVQRGHASVRPPQAGWAF